MIWSPTIKLLVISKCIAGWNFFNSWRLSTNWNEKRLSNNSQVVKVLVRLLKKRSEHITLHIGTNDDILKKSIQILDELLQLKQYFTNMLPTCRVIALTLTNFNKYLRQLEEEFTDNVNIKEVDLGKKI